MKRIIAFLTFLLVLNIAANAFGTKYHAALAYIAEQHILKGDILQGRNWAQHRGIRYQILRDF